MKSSSILFSSNCFNSGLITSELQPDVITPILNGSEKDANVAMNFRRIAGSLILSCMYKTYSSILNSHLVYHLENFEIAADEQNGFRSTCSCEEHNSTHQ